MKRRRKVIDLTETIELNYLWYATFICIVLFTFQGITFKRVGVPTATDIIKASSKDAIRCVGWLRPWCISLVQRGCLDYLMPSLRTNRY